jgi:hypothetical protein
VTRVRSRLAMLASLLLAAGPIAAAAAAEQAAPAAETAAPSFGEWIGDWAGKGVVFGQPASATVRFAPALDGKAMVQDYSLSLEGSRPQSFWGHGSYLIDAKGVVTGQWTDSARSLHDLKGRLTPGSWAIHWGSPLTEIGRTVHRLDADGAMTITDSTLQSDGSWRQFAEMRYTRRGS